MPSEDDRDQIQSDQERSVHGESEGTRSIRHYFDASRITADQIALVLLESEQNGVRCQPEDDGSISDSRPEK